MVENETRFLSLSGQGFQLIRGTVMAEKKEFIRIRGARENNLKALNVDIPRNQFVVFTGLRMEFPMHVLYFMQRSSGMPINWTTAV